MRVETAREAGQPRPHGGGVAVPSQDTDEGKETVTQHRPAETTPGRKRM